MNTKDKEKNNEPDKKPEIIKRPSDESRLTVTNQIKANINKLEKKKDEN